MSLQNILDSLRPHQGQRIHDLVTQAGVNTTLWSVSKRTGEAIDPYTNTYRNSQWTFGGGDEPLVACIWWNELLIRDEKIIREGSAKGDATEWAN